MDILYTIFSITKRRSLRTKSYRNTFKKILKNKQRISLILVTRTQSKYYKIIYNYIDAIQVEIGKPSLQTYRLLLRKKSIINRLKKKLINSSEMAVSLIHGGILQIVSREHQNQQYRHPRLLLRHPELQHPKLQHPELLHQQQKSSINKISHKINIPTPLYRHHSQIYLCYRTYLYHITHPH